ncbi:uncharacterized protein LOC111823329 isoform X1 [Myotis lucifugus]|uniref:uncharacterized protein LOC111823329 isoform X1 n=1 Tax=Myotis lucifugus TaxID=59463 RepID=UPI000CCC2523|nr:uncharacterized protein LOC111823329 isoform X1 [Myotis lucifugus]
MQSAQGTLAASRKGLDSARGLGPAVGRTGHCVRGSLESRACGEGWTAGPGLEGASPSGWPRLQPTHQLRTRPKPLPSGTLPRARLGVLDPERQVAGRAQGPCQCPEARTPPAPPQVRLQAASVLTVASGTIAQGLSPITSPRDSQSPREEPARQDEAGSGNQEHFWGPRPGPLDCPDQGCGQRWWVASATLKGEAKSCTAWEPKPRVSEQ